jgi:IclR family mhp operon transcriptional activator
VTQGKPNLSGLRVLKVLEAVNRIGICNNATVADELGMPRATTYRYLETLRNSGYLVKDKVTHSFRPSYKVRELSCGFEEESWIEDCAGPEMDRLGALLVWPAAISTLSGTSMLLRFSTDATSPLAVKQFLSGSRVGILDTASGLTYLAHLNEEVRSTVIAVLARSSDPRDRIARDSAVLSRALSVIRDRGYGAGTVQRPRGPWRAIAVPVFSKKRILACLAVRFAGSAVSREVAIDSFLPKLQASALRISEAFDAMPAAKGNGIGHDPMIMQEDY